jgi:hypothetical protein
VGNQFLEISTFAGTAKPSEGTVTEFNERQGATTKHTKTDGRADDEDRKIWDRKMTDGSSALILSVGLGITKKNRG